MPVGVLPDAVGVAAALAAPLLMQLSTQDYVSVSYIVNKFLSLNVTNLVVGIVSGSSVTLGAVGDAIRNAVGLIALGDTLCAAVIVTDGACRGELLVHALIMNGSSGTHKLQDKQPP